MTEDLRTQPQTAELGSASELTAYCVDRATGLDPFWYKDAVIYQLHVKAFFDSNGDGIGDFVGLTQKLDYILELGVDTIWLLPFYPSPMRDDGYDIADYTNVHPDYGTLDDFRSFIAAAHERGLKVITELVINHTSDQHPWFQRARHAPAGSPEREFYVWSDDDKKFSGTRIIFTDTETSNWAWDQQAKQYYWHRFFSHQPDLNHNNPAVVDAVIEVMKFWMDMGVDGMRLDAIPYLCVREGTNNENLPETHAVIKRMRAAMDAHYRGRMFLAEANQWPEDVREYFGDGDECQMAYHFPLMPRMFMAVALEDRYPVTEILRQTPDIPENCQWAIFLRNHDELTLEMVTDRERDYMYRMYAKEPRMRVNVGIRRRLAPLLNNDIDRIKLMNSLLLSMPGSPIIYYGDEIGMGDNIYIGDRNGVRTPMQWSLDRNAGYSRTDPQRLYLPVIMDPIYGFQAVNAEAQSRDPSSLLNWTRRILAVRKQHHCFGRGTLEFVRAQNRKILAYVRSFDGEQVLCVANLAQTAQAVELDLSKYKGRVPVELLGRNAFPPIGDLPYFLTLAAHGFFWLLLSDSAVAPSWHVERLPTAELPVLVLTDGLATLLTDTPGATGVTTSGATVRRTMQHLEHEVLPEFLSPRGWLLREQGRIGAVRLGTRTLWRFEQRTFLLNYVDVQQGETSHRYFLPMTIAWEDAPDSGALRTAEWTMAKVREHSRTGVLIDAFADPLFCSHVVRCIAQGETVPFGPGEVRFEQEGELGDLDAALKAVHHIGSESTNTSIIFNDRLFMKVYRRAEAGIHPDVEMVRHLTKVGFTAVAPLLGTVAHVTEGRTELASLFTYVRNQGDAWTYTLNHLDRYIAAVSATDSSGAEAPHALFVAQIQTLGRRLGEMHKLLCGSRADTAFAPEPIRAADLSDWVNNVIASAQSTLQRLEQAVRTLPEAARAPAQVLLNAREALNDHIRALCCDPVEAMKMRIHGNLHLGKAMLVADDFLITGFEGDITRSTADRRRKDSALRDVATLLRSLQYARYAALEHSLATRPDLIERIEPRLQEWEDLSTEALLRGYRRGFDDAPCAPANTNAMMRLVDLFQIDRALHEVQSEIEHRPAWVSVPCRALLSLLERGR